ncbi:MAG TPA: aminotransferase class III-fold pyridoxal phosphate-dependent enzyme [Solirubrobacterales bacterium]|nr:aminotransferase class III-fold pyridoxal phosphate-dependent enzyme [Solirubrobacterales bacterium]
MSPGAETFGRLRRRQGPGVALGAKLAGRGAVETGAEGATVRVSDGREVLDFGSYGVTLLGHRHPDVVAAVVAETARMPTSTRLLANRTTAALVERLGALPGPPLERVWLGSDGADAVEVALKLARLASGRRRVLAVHGAFHGKTLGALALTWNPAFRAGLDGLLGAVTHVDPADPAAVAREVARGDVAALVFEPILGEAGARRLDPATLRRWAADARAAGAFVISDEIQTGLWRCGEPALAPTLGIEVDAVLLGKALGGGLMPIAALVAAPRLHEPLWRDPTLHTSTFGGHPLSCAAALAAIDALEELRPRILTLAGELDRRLDELALRHRGAVVAVHGEGLLRGVELATPALVGAALVEAAAGGLLLSPCLSAPRTLRLLPPAVTTDAQLGAAIEILGRAIGAAAREGWGEVDVGSAAGARAAEVTAR